MFVASIAAFVSVSNENSSNDENDDVARFGDPLSGDASTDRRDADRRQKEERRFAERRFGRPEAAERRFENRPDSEAGQ